MSHDLHPDEEGTILFDGCPECESRANSGLKGVLYLDSINLDLLWNRMLNTEYSQRSGKPETGYYRSHCERRLGHQLYLIGVLFERTGEDVWNRSWSVAATVRRNEIRVQS